MAGAPATTKPKRVVLTKNQKKRLKKKQERAAAAAAPAPAPTPEPAPAPAEEKVTVEYVSAAYDAGAAHDLFADVFAKFASAESLTSDAVEEEPKPQEPEKKKDEKAEAEEEEEKELSRKQRKAMSRMTVAELKQMVAHPETVEAHDVTANDPKLLVFLKASVRRRPLFNGSRRRRGVYRGSSAEARRGDAAGATWTARGEGSRRRRGCLVDLPRRGIAATPTSSGGSGAAAPTPRPRGAAAPKRRRNATLAPLQVPQHGARPAALVPQAQVPPGQARRREEALAAARVHRADRSARPRVFAFEKKTRGTRTKPSISKTVIPVRGGPKTGNRGAEDISHAESPFSGRRTSRPLRDRAARRSL